MIGIPSTRPATPTSRNPPFRPRQRIVGTTAVDWALFVGPVDRAGLERTWVAVRMLYPSLSPKNSGLQSYLKNHSYLDTSCLELDSNPNVIAMPALLLVRSSADARVAQQKKASKTGFLTAVCGSCARCGGETVLKKKDPGEGSSPPAPPPHPRASARRGSRRSRAT